MKSPSCQEKPQYRFVAIAFAGEKTTPFSLSGRLTLPFSGMVVHPVSGVGTTVSLLFCAGAVASMSIIAGVLRSAIAGTMGKICFVERRAE